MSNVLRQGTLIKSPPGGRNRLGSLKHWRERYFVLDATQLSYYENLKAYSRGEKSLGYIEIKDCIDIELHSSNQEKRDFLVEIRTAEECKHKGRLFKLSAENQIAQKEWYEAIRKCMRKPVELSDDDASHADEEPTSYEQSSPTPLALSIEKTINSSSEAKLSQSWDSKAFKDETVHRKDVTYGEAEDEAIDDVFCGPEDVTETTGKLPPTRRPDSQRSSGYLSYGRSSDCSRCSEFSDMFRRSHGSGADLFEFSAQFDGPRITAKMKATIRAESMGNIYESSMKAGLSREEPKRLSLQEQVDLILGRSSSRDETSGQRSPVENSYKEPQPCRKCEGQRTGLDSFGKGNCAKSTDDDIRSSRASESIDLAESAIVTCQQNLTSELGTAGVKMRPRLQHRQCSKIGERSEEGINHRSRSDPTSTRSKNREMQTMVFV